MSTGNKVLMVTNKGEIILQLFPEHASGTVKNFKSFVNQGLYDGVLFHRVEENFLIQTGDPLTKDPNQQNLWGTGGTDHQLLSKEDKISDILKHRPGAVVVADPYRSQFYIVLTRKTAKHLDGKYMIFAQVVKGMDKINRMEIGDKIIRMTVLPNM